MIATASNPSDTLKTYWDRRATRGFDYQGDRFYTTTPIGYYVARRKRLLSSLEMIFAHHATDAAMLDFGCGDGFYSLHFAELFPRMRFFGCNISASMIAEARRAAAARCSPVQLQRSEGLIPFSDRFDIIVAIAVFAHILSQSELETVIREIRNHLQEGGEVILFETTGRRTRTGSTWRRVRSGYYRTLFEEAGFRTKREEVISFPFYAHLGRYLLLLLAFVAFRGDFVRANGNRFYQWCSERIMKLSSLADPWLRSGVGNTLYVFQKGQGLSSFVHCTHRLES